MNVSANCVHRVFPSSFKGHSVARKLGSIAGTEWRNRKRDVGVGGIIGTGNETTPLNKRRYYLSIIRK